MFGLTDNQLRVVMDAAHMVPVEKRDLYLQRIASMLTMRGRGHFTDSDVAGAPGVTAWAMRAYLCRTCCQILSLRI
jgi:hypothetical protein